MESGGKGISIPGLLLNISPDVLKMRFPIKTLPGLTSMESFYSSIYLPVSPPAAQLINKNAHFSPLKSSSSDVIADGLFA